MATETNLIGDLMSHLEFILCNLKYIPEPMVIVILVNNTLGIHIITQDITIHLCLASYSL